MALPEGLKSFVDFITGGFKEEYEEDDGAITELLNGNNTYETDGAVAIDQMYGPKPQIKPVETRSFTRESNVVSHPNSYKSAEVNVIEPRSFSEAAQIVKKLNDKKTVVLHLDLLDKEQSQRTIDFVCGASHALGGTAQKISDMVFIFTPSNVSLSVENGAAQSKFVESLWNRPQ